MASTGSDSPVEPLTMEVARAYVEGKALTASTIGPVGLELESHLVNLAAPAERVSYQDVKSELTSLGELPGRSLLTMEPGGQVEVSSPPAAGVSAAIDLLRQDLHQVKSAVADRGWGLATVGTDPARPAVRINPAQRYAAMTEHWAAVGHSGPGAVMMCLSASLQLNVNAGPASGWPARVRLAHDLGPVLIAISACSPVLVGVPTGWQSTRQRTWTELDSRRCAAPAFSNRPAEDWASFALAAPVMLVRDPSTAPGKAGAATAVTDCVPFSAWIDGGPELGGRRPTAADLDVHLTTLFPPVRLRGFLEIRYLDAVPDRWWPALAAVAAVLLDDRKAADLAADAVGPVAGLWLEAARDGLAHPGLAVAARRCLEIATDHAPAELAASVGELAEIVRSGRCPGDDLLERCRAVGALDALAEYAGAG